MRRCVECKSGRIRKGEVQEELNVNGVLFTAKLPALVCRACGNNYVTHETLGRFELAVADWLGQHGVRTAEAFRFMRKSLGLKATEVAELFDVTPETISRWENGHGSVDVGAFAVLGELVSERLNGTQRTLIRLHAVKKNLGKRLAKTVALELPKARSGVGDVGVIRS